MKHVELGHWVKESRTKAGLSQEQLAKHLGLSTKASISSIETGRTLPSYEQMLSISKLCNVSFPHEAARNRSSFDDLQSPSEDEYVIIPQYSAKGECGTGEMNEHVEIRGGLSFKKSWLAAMGLKPRNLEVLYATGDSMATTIMDGSVVLIDVSQIEPKEGKVFAIIRSGNGLVFKRLIRDRDGSWLYMSDNENKTLYPNMHPIEDDVIIGRVVWQGGNGGF